MTKLSKLSIALLAMGASSLAMANDAVTVYGKANLTFQSSDEGDGGFTELKSNASRFGVKGGTKLSSDLEVFYLLEWQVDLADLSDDDNIKSRNQYVGLKGDFGRIMLGRNDTVLKSVSSAFDQFSDYEADIKGLWKGENRMSDSITYVSPSFGQFSVGVSYIVEDEVDGEDGVSTAVYYGDKKLKKSTWYAMAAMDSDVKGYDTTRVGVQTKLGKVLVGAMYHEQENTETGVKEDGMLLNLGYTINKWKFKANYQELESDDSFSVGADYKLGKNTKAFAWYTDRGLEGSEDKNWLAVGIEHKF